MKQGVDIKIGDGGNRVELQCVHQRGCLYVVPSEASWVCTQEQLCGHSIAGFFKELVALEDPRLDRLMQRWGLYYRALPLDEPLQEKER
ncbi:MAG: hypothetical protein HY676_01515 [Chloroflexi bacterium]|nr:hypothetical protein [Chloroflexota bacterium]